MKSVESSVVVQDLELATKRADQYYVGSLSWSSLILIANFVAVYQPHTSHPPKSVVCRHLYRQVLA